MKTLATLKVGGQGQVRCLHGHDDITVRLMEMGLTPGVEVSVQGVAPLGDPMELEVRGYRLSVRRCEAERVELV